MPRSLARLGYLVVIKTFGSHRTGSHRTLSGVLHRSEGPQLIDDEVDRHCHDDGEDLGPVLA